MGIAIVFASGGMKENHLDEACGLAPETMIDACVTFVPKCKVAKMVAAGIAVANRMDYETVMQGCAT